MQILFLIFAGLILGAYGTMIGAGGGFLLVPLLLLMDRHLHASTVTGISLAVVFFNAASGSYAYARMKRIDYLSGSMFALASIPGAVLGVLAIHHIARKHFDPVFGTLLLLLAGFLLIHPSFRSTVSRGWLRVIKDREGVIHQFRYRPWVGLLISTGVGFISSLFGIGGGVIHVPALINLMNFPPHLATATSHFVLAITALTATLIHLSDGSLVGHGKTVAALSIGVLIGAQFGASLSQRLHGKAIVQMLAIALALVGLRLLMTVIF